MSMSVGPPDPTAKTEPSLENSFRSRSPLEGRISPIHLVQDSALIASAEKSGTCFSQIPSLIGPLPLATFEDRDLRTSGGNKARCEEVKAIIETDVSHMVSEIDYNGLGIVVDFIDFYETEHAKHPEDSPLKIFERFQPDSHQEASTLHGSTCVGKAHDLVERLKKKGIESHIVIEKEQGDNLPTHAAVVAPCSNGLLLIEIEHDTPVRILKPDIPFEQRYPGQDSLSSLLLSFAIVEVPRDYQSFEPIIARKEEQISESSTKVSQAEYILKPCLNPDESVMKRWMAESHFYPISTGARKDQEPHSIQVNLRPTPGYPEGKITFGIGEKKFRLPLSAVDPLTRTIDYGQLTPDPKLQLSEPEEKEYQDLLSSGGFFEAFESRAHIMNQIFMVCSHQNLLRQIQTSS